MCKSKSFCREGLVLGTVLTGWDGGKPIYKKLYQSEWFATPGLDKLVLFNDYSGRRLGDKPVAKYFKYYGLIYIGEDFDIQDQRSDYIVHTACPTPPYIPQLIRDDTLEAKLHNEIEMALAAADFGLRATFQFGGKYGTLPELKNTEQLFDRETAIKHCGVSEDVFNRWVDKGPLWSFNINGNIRYTETDLFVAKTIEQGELLSEPPLGFRKNLKNKKGGENE